VHPDIITQYRNLKGGQPKQTVQFQRLWYGKAHGALDQIVQPLGNVLYRTLADISVCEEIHNISITPGPGSGNRFSHQADTGNQSETQH
jgi:hypothetical protein